MKKNNLIKWFIGIAILALAAFAIFRFTSKDEIKGEKVEVKKGDIATYYNFSGSIEAKNKSNLFAELPLQINEFLVKEGENVKEGDILYKTSTGEEIKSKIDGQVYKIEVEEDAQISPGTKIIEIVNYKDLELKVKVDEYDLNAISIGTKAEIIINALDKSIDGEVVKIEKQGVYTNGITFFDTIISIEKDDAIRIGMSAEAMVLDKESRDTKILPMKAIKFRDDNSPYVEIKTEEKIEEKEIEIGISDGVNVEVKSGLELGDQVFIPRSQVTNFGPPEGVENFNDDESGVDKDE